MLKVLTAYAVAGVVMLALDAIWLMSMNGVYRQQLGDLLMDGFRPASAAAFYLLYVAGMIYFAVLPALRDGDWLTAALNGAVLGLVAYGTYDLTNQATMKTWSTQITIMDMAWGAALTAAASTAAFIAVRRFFGA